MINNKCKVNLVNILSFVTECKDTVSKTSPYKYVKKLSDDSVRQKTYFSCRKLVKELPEVCETEVKEKCCESCK